MFSHNLQPSCLQWERAGPHPGSGNYFDWTRRFIFVPFNTVSIDSCRSISRTSLCGTHSRIHITFDRAKDKPQIREMLVSSNAEDYGTSTLRSSTESSHELKGGLWTVFYQFAKTVLADIAQKESMIAVSISIENRLTQITSILVAFNSHVLVNLQFTRIIV